jgi:5-methylcytosine-specific restriction endonuclease McrA
MASNPFGASFIRKETSFKNPYLPQDNRKRTLGQRDRQILFSQAGGRCKNPYCKKKISYPEMQIGHKKAFSRGGNTTLKNSVCLCYSCNKLQGTDSWEKFLKKQATARGQAEPKVSKSKEAKPKKKRSSSSSNSYGSISIPKISIPKFKF